jgi:7-cyano-7-deazaguanine synthase
MIKRALVLFSGGQDSTTCLMWALQRYDIVETIGFDYGQRHAVELQCRTRILNDLPRLFPYTAGKVQNDHMLALPTLSALSDTALTRDVEIEMQKDGLPNTFVPGRNLLFFTYAAALAYRRGITDLVGGMCETDYSGYPDCRDATLKSLEDAISKGMARNFTIHTPLMWLDKAATWKLAEEIGGNPLLDFIRDETHTCYKGERGQKHDWGYGCGTCPACDLRAKGHAQFMAK